MYAHVLVLVRELTNRTSKPLFERYLGGSDPYAVCSSDMLIIVRVCARNVSG